MCAEFIGPIASTITASSIKRLLAKSTPNLFEIKHIIINGISDTIDFIIHFIKASKNNKILRRIFPKPESFTFERDFNIEITNRLGEDVTRDILEYEAKKIVIRFEKFFDVQGKLFIIHARGRFMEMFSDLFLTSSSIEPIINNEDQIVYLTKVVVYHKKYDTEKFTCINVPFKKQFLIDFIGPSLLTQREVKAFRHLNKEKLRTPLHSRREKSLRQKWGFDPDLLTERISGFLGVLEGFFTRRFREFIIATSETHSVQITKVNLEFSRIQQGLPVIFITPVICFDYKEGDPEIIDISISINKRIILKQATKLWAKFKKPKQTAPKKTLC